MHLKRTVDLGLHLLRKSLQRLALVQPLIVVELRQEYSLRKLYQRNSFLPVRDRNRRSQLRSIYIINCLTYAVKVCIIGHSTLIPICIEKPADTLFYEKVPAGCTK